MIIKAENGETKTEKFRRKNMKFLLNDISKGLHK